MGKFTRQDKSGNQEEGNTSSEGIHHRSQENRKWGDKQEREKN